MVSLLLASITCAAAGSTAGGDEIVGSALGRMRGVEEKDASSPLGYATPRVIFRGEYRCRGADVLRGVILLGFGAWAFWGSAAVYRGGTMEPQRLLWLLLLMAVALCLLVGGGWLLWAGIGGKRAWDVLITEDGIARNGRLFLWEEIGSFGAVLAGRGVFIQFQRRTRWGLPMPRPLELTPPLSAEEYRQLADRLTKEIRPKHRHLYIAPEAIRG